jgi:flagellar M-ring protein FliF
MDFVNKGYAQLADLFRSMSAGTRLATVLLLALVALSLGYLFQYPVTGGGEFLLNGRPFAQHELTAIEAAFAKAGLGKSEITGNRIRIPRGQKEVYLAALADNNALPADFYKYLDEASAADNPFSSTKSLEMRRWNAKQKELALIISRMKNIESATVQYDEETKRGLVQQKQKTAMVAVQTGGARLDDEQVKAIRNVVASAYAGLDRHQISITDMTSGFSYGGAIGPDGTTEDDSLYASHKLRYERDWQRKIVEQISYIPGVLVGVNVELNPEVERSSSSVKVDPKPVALKTTEETKESTTSAPQVSGRPGAQANGVNGNTPIDIRQAAGTASGNQTTESRSDVQNISGHETQHVKNVALVPKRVTASIDIPASYFAQVWNRRNPPLAGQEPKAPDAGEIAKIETETKERIKEAIRNLLPEVAQGTNPYPHIVVSTYADIPSVASVTPSLAANSTTWLADNWQTLALVGLGLMGLLMLRSMVRSPGGLPTAAAPAKAESGQSRPSLNVISDDDTPEPVRTLKNRFGTPGPDLRTELHEIVKENPDAAAQVLRAWIGEAA